MSEHSADDADEWSELGDVLLVLIALFTPLFIILVLIGPSREILASLGVYGLFVAGSLLLTGIILWEG